MADPDPSPDDFLARWQREQDERQAKARADLRYYAGMLAFLGVKAVRAEFDGYGDSGQLSDPAFDPPPPAGLPDGAAAAVADALGNLLEPGWEINEGSFGAVALDTATGEAQVDQNWRDEEPGVDGDDEEVG